MALETKVILTMLAERIARAKTVAEAFSAVRNAANVEGTVLPTYTEYVKQLKAEDEQNENG